MVMKMKVAVVPQGQDGLLVTEMKAEVAPQDQEVLLVMEAKAEVVLQDREGLLVMETKEAVRGDQADHQVMVMETAEAGVVHQEVCATRVQTGEPEVMKEATVVVIQMSRII